MLIVENLDFTQRTSMTIIPVGAQVEIVINVDLSQCPQCHTFQFLSKDSLVGLNEDDYEELEWRL